MKTILREEAFGVSEVLGTILILAMTVALFSVAIVWVSAIPTPQVQTRSDLSPSLQPLFGPTGLVVGVNLTLTYTGGEALQPAATVFYIEDQPASGPSTTDVAPLHRFDARIPNPSGLIDGSDSVWNVGERWVYLNQAFRPQDTITVTVVDTTRSVIVWSGAMNSAAGTRPPVFLSVWASGLITNGTPNPVLAGLGFFLYADVWAPDHDLNPNSVYASLTVWYGSGTQCSVPLKMHDDGVSPDLVAGDGIFSLGNNVCMNPPYPAIKWSGSYILLNATDLNGHQTQTRFVLDVVSPSGSSGGGGNTIPNQVWQYIGFVQIRTGEVWVSNLSNPYPTANTYQPFQVSASWLNNGPALFHFKMSNHGNTTIFVDGWTEAFFQVTQGSGTSTSLFVVAPCNPNVNAYPGGGIQKYPGNGTINDFQYAHSGLPAGCTAGLQPAVFDINPFDQQTGGAPYTVLLANTQKPFSLPSTSAWAKPGVYYISILIAGMAGPVNYTYAQLTAGAGNPYHCSGLGTNYNPILHLNDPIAACRTTWYAQVIPFIGMVVF